MHRYHAAGASLLVLDIVFVYEITKWCMSTVAGEFLSWEKGREKRGHGGKGRLKIGEIFSQRIYSSIP